MHLDGVPELSDALLVALSKAAPLQRVSLARCGGVSDEGLCGLAAQCPGLLELALDGCAVTDLTLRALAAHCKGLQALSLRGCVRVSSAALAGVAALGTLRRLCLNGIPQVRGVNAGSALTLAGLECVILPTPPSLKTLMYVAPKKHPDL